MEDKNVMQVCMDLHDFLEDKDIYYPQSLFVLECYKAWTLKCAKETELNNYKDD